MTIKAKAINVPHDDPAYMQFSGGFKVTAENHRNPDPKLHVAASVEFTDLSATPNGLGKALAMVARQYLAAIPDNATDKAGATLAVLEAFGDSLLRDSARVLEHGGLNS